MHPVTPQVLPAGSVDLVLRVAAEPVRKRGRYVRPSKGLGHFAVLSLTKP
jgi:hypothetical protein